MATIKEYWANMSPAERSMEMRRRMKLGRERPREKPQRRFTPAGREAIREAQRERWRRAKQLERGSRSPFPNVSPVDTQGTIRARLEAIEAAVAQLKADIGL